MAQRPESNRVYTAAEVEASEIAVELNEFLIDKFSDYSAHVVLAALLINVDGLVTAIKTQKEKQDESSS